MEANSADTQVRDHVVSIFDGQSMDFRLWMERMEFHLMANGLYSGILDDEEPADKKTLPQKQRSRDDPARG
jgi:hypothetical protein